MNKIIIIGAGGHARSCIDVIEEQNKYEIAGLIDRKETSLENYHGYDIIGFDTDLKELRKKYKLSFIAIGQTNKSSKRIEIYLLLKSLNYSLPLIISPHAYVSKNAKIDEGSIIMHGAVVNSGARIGANCIINSQALIEHDASVHNHCHISTGAIINGGVSVGKQTFIGSQVVTKESVKIGSNCIVGAGAKIINDVKKDSKVINKH